MIFLVHGENYTKTRDTVVKIKNKLNISNSKTLTLDEESIKDVLVELNSTDLFDTKKILTIEISKQKQQQIEELLQKETNIPQDTHLILLFDNALRKNSKVIKLAIKNPNVKIAETFETTKSNVFNFTDALLNKDKKRAYKELEKLLETEDEFYIFSMILYGFKNLALAKYETNTYKKLHPYVQSKLNKQKEKYTKDEIKSIFMLLLDIEEKVKTGKLTLDIAIPMTIEKVLI